MPLSGIPGLIGRPEQKKLEILLGDVCKLDTLPYFDVCISNTPYQVLLLALTKD